MMVVIVEFELRAGAEAEFETALQQMQEQIKTYDGFLGEAALLQNRRREKVRNPILLDRSRIDQSLAERSGACENSATGPG